MKIQLHEILLRQGLTQRGAARKTGVSENGIGVLCRSPRLIRIETLTKLCAGLGVTPNDLFGVAQANHPPVTVTENQYNYSEKNE